MQKSFVFGSGLLLCLVATGISAESSTKAGNAAKGGILAKQCVCHKKGFASLRSDEFIERMTDFKKGKRSPKSMVSVARELSEQDVVDLAAFFTEN